MKIASIVGARPEFVQAAVVSSVIREQHQEVLIHTGQHYDDLMSDVFFRDLKLPLPDVNLDVGSNAPSTQTGQMLARLESLFHEVDPDLVIVRGDTNSTLAGALAAKQSLFPVAHIEAGMRSFDLTAPEEINRVITDRIADFLFTVDENDAARLAMETVPGHVFVVGDVMYDTYCKATTTLPIPQNGAYVRRTGSYDLLTIHRSENTDDPLKLRRLISAFGKAPRPVIFPIHPRTRKRLQDFGIALPSAIEAVEPLGYLEMLAAERNAHCVFTDSGGVQREAYYAGVECVTLRDVTEWTNTVKAGWNVLVGDSSERIGEELVKPRHSQRPHPPLFGDGRASYKIAEILNLSQVQEVITTRRRVRTSRPA
jgi:UDP-N-acetylglucosamine 2-epimerase